MSRFTFALMIAFAAAVSAQTPADPVGFPRDLAHFEQVRTMSTQGANAQIGFVKLNGPAATVTSAEAPKYPYGSVAVMEWWSIAKDEQGQPRRDAAGKPVKDALVKFDVMRKERGFGAGYQDGRSGEWEYASYSPDGKLLTTAAEGKACASCHKKAGEARDFVYVGRFTPAK
jgi:hypothetical protein